MQFPITKTRPEDAQTAVAELIATLCGNVVIQEKTISKCLYKKMPREDSKPGEDYLLVRDWNGKGV